MTDTTTKPLKPLKARKYCENFSGWSSLLPKKESKKRRVMKSPHHPKKSVKIDVENPPKTVVGEKYLPRDRRCLVERFSLIHNPILEHDEICECKIIAEECTNPAKEYLRHIYSSENYQKRMKKIKRGNNAQNWKKTGTNEFLCPSLHFANNIYEAIGKKKWTHNKDRKNYKECPIDLRCSQILKSGKRCSKRCCGEYDLCTLHLKKRQMNR
tara:strand:- start:337 stop:972 length:636 start_codon:yes stop_codon:yes gene_type:complete